MSELIKACPKCGYPVKTYKNPFPTVDIIIPVDQKVILIERRNPPFGWAIPGGFVDYGESVEQAALREAKEETGLEVSLRTLLGVYSDPKRDPRFHTISIVFVAEPKDLSTLKAGDDAARVKFFALKSLPELAFDHQKILSDFCDWYQKVSNL
ncbi:MAG: NUDIX hydrolase [Desulfonauticus sp.]|nr:NUDIX hydrolase [Desulfonauticus sp.]